jgi:hypothetical protein
MNRDANTRSALLAIARNRRVQRALAHAYLNRGNALPTLRSSLGYMTSTGCISESDDGRAGGHHMSILGVSRSEAVVYVVEDLGLGDAPIVYRLFLAGPRQGYLVPIHAWYESADNAAEIRARIDALATTLEPAVRSTVEAWMLSTRVVQRRALPVVDHHTPIRKFALQLSVEPVSGIGPSGKSTVTAFLRPNAELVEVWSLGEAVIARVTFTGVPSGLGLLKDTVILLTDRLA